MLTFSTLEFDLGDVKFTKEASYPITITNPTSADVVVHNSGSTCSCTTGSMNKNPILANGTGIFTIKFNSNKTGRGLQTKSITVSWVINGRSFSQALRFKVNVT